MANVVLKWLGNKLFNGTKMICSIKGNNVKVDKTNLGDLIDVNIEELEEDVERALLGNHVYSTTERVCGEWIDGSNIYEQTYPLTTTLTLSSNSWVETQIPITDVKMFIECVGMSENGVTMPLAITNNKEVYTDGYARVLNLRNSSSDIKNIFVKYIKEEV